jgi:hypothetical protein
MVDVRILTGDKFEAEFRVKVEVVDRLLRRAMRHALEWSIRMLKEMRGVCLLFSESGTEGGWWAMQQDRFITEDGHWSYQCLHYLLKGDDFTVYAEDGAVLFHGVIHPDGKTGAVPRQVMRIGKLVNHRTPKQQVVGVFWVHWIQKGIGL